MTISLKVSVLPEPYLEFGDGSRYREPKTGLIESGPFSLRYGNDIPGSVRLGFVGPSEMIEAGHEWFQRCQNGILTANSNRRRHPDFSPFDEIFRTKLDIQSRWTSELSQREFIKVFQTPPNQQFQGLVDLYDDAVKRLSERELGPNIIVCSLSDDLLEQFHTWQSTGGSKRPKRRRRPEQNPQQMTMFADQSEDDNADNSALVHNFRRSLKARAMEHNIPIQLAHNGLFVDKEGGDDPATKAWDVCTACFYKAGGIPWRLGDGSPYTCFVGISFHHLRKEKTHIVYSSCAQAFPTEDEGFVLRGDDVDWSDQVDRTPHLNESQAYNLGLAVASEYRNRTGRNPIRIVLHKTSKFEAQERAGFAAAWQEIPELEFTTLDYSPLKLMPRGDYPPRRGTLVDLNGSKHLYTTGFYEPWGSYPGPHVPRPVELRHEQGDQQIERSCREILGLTKMSFNSARPFGAMPITTKMATEVGLIMGALEEGRTPEPSYRYYM